MDHGRGPERVLEQPILEGTRKDSQEPEKVPKESQSKANLIRF